MEEEEEVVEGRMGKPWDDADDDEEEEEVAEKAGRSTNVECPPCSGCYFSDAAVCDRETESEED